MIIKRARARNKKKERETKMENMIKIEIGKKYTVFEINAMAMTCKREITITREQNRRWVYKERGKRKEYFFTPRDSAIFETWDIPLYCDTDKEATRKDGVHVFRGNACFNFIGDSETIKNWIETKQINPSFRKELTLAIDIEAQEGREETIVYPEMQCTHAVIRKIKERAA